MRQINVLASVMTIVNKFSAYLLARLRGNPSLADIATAAQKGQDDLSQSQQSYWSAQQGTMQAASFRDSRKYQCDVALRSLRAAVLGWVHNDRTSKLYNAVFPNGFSAVLCYDAGDELQLARNILIKVADNDIDALVPAVQALQAAVDDLTNALAAYETAERAETEAWTALQAAKVTYSTRYDAIYCQLLMRLGERGLVESYFRRVPPSTPAQPAPTPTPTPTPTSTPTPTPAAASGSGAKAGSEVKSASEAKPVPETVPAAVSLAVGTRSEENSRLGVRAQPESVESRAEPVASRMEHVASGTEHMASA